MKRIVALGIGVSLMLLSAYVGHRMASSGSHQKPHYFISLPQGALLCSVGTMEPTGWQTIICSRIGISNLTGDIPSTEDSLEPTMLPKEWD